MGSCHLGLPSSPKRIVPKKSLSSFSSLSTAAIGPTTLKNHAWPSTGTIAANIRSAGSPGVAAGGASAPDFDLGFLRRRIGANLLGLPAAYGKCRSKHGERKQLRPSPNVKSWRHATDAAWPRRRKREAGRPGARIAGEAGGGTGLRIITKSAGGVTQDVRP